MIRFLVLISLTVAALFGQSSARGTVQGTVKDATGGIIRGASVTLATDSGTVQNVIDKMREISSGIAAAVEEQGEVAREIARNVQEAATGACQVSENISGVMQAIMTTGGVSAQVLSSAECLEGNSDRLRREVGEFLGSIV